MAKRIFTMSANWRSRMIVSVVFVIGLILPIQAGSGSDDPLIIYSGRSEDLVGPLIERFRTSSGFEVKVRYGKTAELASLILEEGRNSPADIFYAQDAGALGALSQSNRLMRLPDSILSQVDSRFRSSKGLWVGTSGRARVVVYNTAKLSESDLPDTIYGFCDPRWKGRIGWAPTNGSFQAFVTALRKTDGEARARQWLTCIQNNQPKVYPKNTPIVAAAGAGEIDVGFVNHYYLYRFLKENGDRFAARNYHPRGGGSDALINVAGAAVLETSSNREKALQFIRFLLRPESQKYFSSETYEYPLIEGVEINRQLTPLVQIKTPNIDLSILSDLEATLELFHDLGIL